MGYSKQTKIDIPQCPNGHGNMIKKEWKMTGKGRRGKMTREEGNTIIIELWTCPECKLSFRRTRK